MEVQLHTSVTPELGAVLSDQFDAPAALHPGQETFVRIEKEVGWGLEPLQILWKNKISAPPPRGESNPDFPVTYFVV